MESEDIKATKNSALKQYLSTGVEWYKYFIKRWWILFLAGVIGGGVGVLIATMDKPDYESKLTFALDDGASANGMSGAAGLAAQFGFSIGGGSNFFSGDNIIEIMKSRRIVEKVLLSVDSSLLVPKTMAQQFLDMQPGIKIVNFPVGKERKTFSYKQDSVLYNIANSFSEEFIKAQRPDKKLNIFEVNVLSGNENFTLLFTKRLVQTTIDYYTELKIKKSKETLDILEQRVAAMKGNLNSSISSRAAVQDANINPAFAKAQAPIQQQQSNIQVFGAAYGELYKNLEITRIQYLKEIPLLQIIDDAEYPMKKIKMGKLTTGIKGALFLFFLVAFTMFLVTSIKKLYAVTDV